MVKGRLPRESDPLPGEKSGFVASHDTTGEEDYKRTSPLNPLPVKSIGDSNVKDAAVKAELESIKATQEAILSKLDSGVNTQVTGSNVEQAFLVNVEKNFIEVNLTGGELDAGKNQIFDVYSNEGEIWTLKRLGYSTSRDSDSEGTQQISIYHGNSSIATNYIADIVGDSTQFLQGTIPGVRVSPYEGNIRPADSFELVESIRDTTVLSDGLPIRIRFRNLSDSVATSRSFKLFFLVEKVNNNGE